MGTGCRVNQEHKVLSWPNDCSKLDGYSGSTNLLTSMKVTEGIGKYRWKLKSWRTKIHTSFFQEARFHYIKKNNRFELLGSTDPQKLNVIFKDNFNFKLSLILNKNFSFFRLWFQRLNIGSLKTLKRVSSQVYLSSLDNNKGKITLSEYLFYFFHFDFFD